LVQTLKNRPLTVAVFEGSDCIVLGLESDTRLEIYHLNKQELFFFAGHRAKTRGGANKASCINVMKAFPQYSDKNFFVVVKNELIRFDIEVLKQTKPEKGGRPAPHDKVYTSKTYITDIVQCDEGHIAVLQNASYITVLDQFNSCIIYHIENIPDVQ